jgi:cytidylate kinase
MIVAVSGWKGSGKDTAAKILVEKYGFRRVAFADVLKDMVADQYGIVRSHCDDPAFKEKPIMSMPASPK